MVYVGVREGVKELKEERGEGVMGEIELWNEEVELMEEEEGGERVEWVIGLELGRVWNEWVEIWVVE